MHKTHIACKARGLLFMNFNENVKLTRNGLLALDCLLQFILILYPTKRFHLLSYQRRSFHLLPVQHISSTLVRADTVLDVQCTVTIVKRGIQEESSISGVTTNYLEQPSR